MTTNPPASRGDPARPVSADHAGGAALLFVPLAGALAVVAAVLLLAAAPGTLALIFAILVALVGTAGVIAVVNRDLSDADGSGPAATSREHGAWPGPKRP